MSPYHTDQWAAALHLVRAMSGSEQRTRMHSMRGDRARMNVYRWAGRMLTDAARMRQRARLMQKTASRQAWNMPENPQ